MGSVWRGEIQARALGDDRRSIRRVRKPGPGSEGRAGLHACRSLRCRSVSGTIPDDRKYHAAYFERFPGVWCHGDYVELTAHDGLIIYGRSDAVLNPGGVRIGTAEIYRQVEQLDEIVESLVVGQQWDGDERVVLFVRLREGISLGPELEDRIRKHIRANTSPRHVPARIVQVTDIPRTRSGKLVELAGTGRCPWTRRPETGKPSPTRKRSSSSGTGRSWGPDFGDVRAARHCPLGKPFTAERAEGAETK